MAYSSSASSKICARILLTVINLFFLAGSIGLIAIGVIGVRQLQSQVTFNNVNIGAMLPIGDMFKPIYIASCGVGSWFTLNSLFGCVGAITRKTRLLGFFILLLCIDMAVVIGGGVVAFLKLRTYRDMINSLSNQQYTALTPGGWLAIQSTLKCCGFTQGDLNTTVLSSSAASMGSSVDQSLLIGNPCTTSATAAQQPACLPSIQGFMDSTTRLYTTLWITVGMVLSFVLILACISLKHRRTAEEKRLAMLGDEQQVSPADFKGKSVVG